jgi:hypothetical protein
MSYNDAYLDYLDAQQADESVHWNQDAEDPYASLFWESVHRMEQDAEWLTAQPHPESELLCRYFGIYARRVKDLLEYQTVLWDCLGYLSRLNVQVTNRISPFALPDEVSGSTPTELSQRNASVVLRANGDWLRAEPRTTPEISRHLFEDEWSIEDRRQELQLMIASCLFELGYSTRFRLNRGVTWEPPVRKEVVR